MKQIKQSFSKQLPTILASWIFLFSFLSCTEVTEVDPVRLTLLRGEDVIHIAGTIHSVPNEIWEDDRIQLLNSEISNLIEASDIFYSETYLPEESEENVALYRSYITGDESRKTMEEYIAEWDSDRQSEFLSSLRKFPNLNHAGRRNTFLSSRPHYAYSFFGSEVGLRSAGINPENSIDALYRTHAIEKDVEVRGLASMFELFEIFESIDQEYYIYELERQILSSPTREDFAAVYEMRMMNIFRSFSTGEYDPEIYNRYLADLKVANLAENNPLMDEWNFALFSQRETAWVKTIEELFNKATSPLTVFIAVGQAHLLSPESVLIDLLEDNG
jgi:uncharacterized protein YbaP (TraB family)